MLQMRHQGLRRPLQGCFSTPEPGSWSPASPGILRALQEMTEPDHSRTSPPRDSTSSPQTPTSTASERAASPWNLNNQERTGEAAASRTEDTEPSQAEEEVPLVDVSRAGQGSLHTKGHTQDKQV